MFKWSQTKGKWKITLISTTFIKTRNLNLEHKGVEKLVENAWFVHFFAQPCVWNTKEMKKSREKHTVCAFWRALLGAVRVFSSTESWKVHGPRCRPCVFAISWSCYKILWFSYFKVSRPYLRPWPTHRLTFIKQLNKSGKPNIKMHLFLLTHDFPKIQQSFLYFSNISKIFTYSCFMFTSKYHPTVFTFLIFHCFHILKKMACLYTSSQLIWRHVQRAQIIKLFQYLQQDF